MSRIPPEFWIVLATLNLITIFVGIMVHHFFLVILGLFNILCCMLSYDVVKKLRKEKGDE